jgi:hypothetical protein
MLHWQAQAPLANDLKASLYLLDEDGRLAGQVDDLLVSDRYLLLDTWKQGEQASTYHILPTIPGIPPGRYKLYAAVYDPETMRRFPVLDAAGMPSETAAFLGDLQVTRPLAPPEVVPATRRCEPAWTLTLLGYDLPVRLNLANAWRSPLLALMASQRATTRWGELRRAGPSGRPPGSAASERALSHDRWSAGESGAG